MPIEVDIKRKFVVNGREYGSMDEVPEDIRGAIQKTLSGKNLEVNTETDIVLNGKKYKKISEMSSSEQEIYEQAMKAAAGNISPEDIGSLGLQLTGSRNAPSGQGISLSFSLTPLFAILIAVLAAIGLYFYIF